MTKYTLSGFYIDTNIVGPDAALHNFPVWGVGQAELSITLLNDETTVQYLLDVPSYQAFSARYGIDIPDDPDFSFTNPSSAPHVPKIGTLVWGDKSTEIFFAFEYINDDVQKTFYFAVGGDPLPDFGSVAEAQAFMDAATSFELIETGPLAPGQDIVLADIPGMIIDENDDIRVFAGLDDLDSFLTGAGDDIVTVINTHRPPAPVEVDLGAGNDSAFSDAFGAALYGNEGDDHIVTDTFASTIFGGNGTDTLSAGDGDDFIFGGTGLDTIDGGHGKDKLWGGANGDRVTGGYGGDTLIGQGGNDTLSGQAWGDNLLGNSGDDFLDGGFGADRLNGGDGADRFFHGGTFAHRGDWIGDYDAAEGDVLVFGNASASASDFRVQLTHATAGTGARVGDTEMQEAFVVYKPTGQIMWVLVDGEAQAEINVQIGGVIYDLA